MKFFLVLFMKIKKKIVESDYFFIIKKKKIFVKFSLFVKNKISK